MRIKPPKQVLRDIDEHRIARIINDIGQSMRLDNPITLEKDGRILDGYHRFIACVRLRIDVEYRFVGEEHSKFALYPKYEID